MRLMHRCASLYQEKWGWNGWGASRALVAACMTQEDDLDDEHQAAPSICTSAGQSVSLQLASFTRNHLHMQLHPAVQQLQVFWAFK